MWISFASHFLFASRIKMRSCHKGFIIFIPSSPPFPASRAVLFYAIAKLYPCYNRSTQEGGETLLESAIEKILLIILGWWLNNFSNIFSSTDKARRRKLTKIFALNNEINRILNCCSFDKFPLSPWWESVRMNYYEDLPKESAEFDEWASFIYNHQKTDGQMCVDKTCYMISILRQSEEFWSQPLHKLILYRLKSTLKL